MSAGRTLPGTKPVRPGTLATRQFFAAFYRPANIASNIAVLVTLGTSLLFLWLRALRPYINRFTPVALGIAPMLVIGFLLENATLQF